jgi:hypothetical protein
MFDSKQIQEYCLALYNFANRYGSQSCLIDKLKFSLTTFTWILASQPQARPSESEIAEMAERAAVVVKLLEEVRRLAMPEGADDDPNAHTLQPEGRAPKRPWEDMSNDDGSANASFTQVTINCSIAPFGFDSHVY